MPSREQKQWNHHEEAKALRQVRKHIKRNRKTKHARRKDWQAYTGPIEDDLDDLDAQYDLGLPSRERVMPRGERERRQALIDGALAAVRKETAEESDLHVDLAGQRGTVIEVSSNLCRVQLEQHILICGVRGSLSAEDTGYTNVVAVGDEVIVSEDGGERGVVDAVLPRRSVLARPDVFDNHLQQVVVANADQLLIVAAWRDPKLWPELIDRYLIAALRSALAPVICLNKVDLSTDVQTCRTALQPYADLGHDVLYTSAITGRGIDRLRDALGGRTTVLAGMSGVGKSTLLNAVQPGLQLRIGDVSEYSHTGRHITTQVNLHHLQLGGYVVDTPGVREFGLSGMLRNDLIGYYPDIAAFQGHCRFADCTHTHEPGCAIKAAVRGGQIATDRYKNYQAIYATLPESRAEERELAQERAWR